MTKGALPGVVWTLGRQEWEDLCQSSYSGFEKSLVTWLVCWGFGVCQGLPGHPFCQRGVAGHWMLATPGVWLTSDVEHRPRRRYLIITCHAVLSMVDGEWLLDIRFALPNPPPKERLRKPACETPEEVTFIHQYFLPPLFLRNAKIMLTKLCFPWRKA